MRKKSILLNLSPFYFIVLSFFVSRVYFLIGPFLFLTRIHIYKLFILIKHNQSVINFDIIISTLVYS